MDTVIGIDIYHNSAFDVEDLKAKGVKFVILKCTQGDGDFVDPKFQERWLALKKAGIIRGAYHFFEAGGSGLSQAQFMLKHMGQLEIGDLPPALDWESDRQNTKYPILPFSQQLAHAQAFMDEVEKATGVTPIFYTGDYRLKEHHHPDSWTKYPLWLAEYSHTLVVPKPFKAAIWQKSDKAHQDAGIKGGGDFNLFQGTYADLVAMTKQAPKV